MKVKCIDKDMFGIFHPNMILEIKDRKEFMNNKMLKFKNFLGWYNVKSFSNDGVRE